MFWWKNRFHVLDKAGGGDGGAGGGGGGQGGDPPATPPAGGKAGDGGAPDAAAIARENADLKARIAALEGKGNGGGGDPDLAERTRREREANDRKATDHKALESAIVFNLQSGEFLKKHGALLPETVKDLFKKADTESYDSPVQKASEIKSGLIQEFFSVQANHDLLTAAQRASLADFLKLTKDGKREKAQATFDNILEPTLERLREVKKAEQVSRARNGYGDDSDAAYKEKLMSHSRQHYLGEKKNGT